MKHILDSKKAIKFFTDAGLTITEGSCHNVIQFKNSNGEVLNLEAESSQGIACGIPGIYAAFEK